MSIHTPLHFSQYVTFGLVFLLTALPPIPFLICFTLNFCCSILPTVIQRPTPRDAVFLTPRLTRFFWSSLFVLILPYALRALASLLQAWSCSIYELSSHISAQNALIAIALECIFLGVSYLKGFYVRLTLKC